MSTKKLLPRPVAEKFFVSISSPLFADGSRSLVQLSTTMLQTDDQLVGNKGLGTPLFVFNQGDDALVISSIAINGHDFTAKNGCITPVDSSNKVPIAIPNCGSTARGVWREHFASSVTTSKSLP
jgi:hypothetical protein